MVLRLLLMAVDWPTAIQLHRITEGVPLRPPTNTNIHKPTGMSRKKEQHTCKKNPGHEKVHSQQE